MAPMMSVKARFDEVIALRQSPTRLSTVRGECLSWWTQLRRQIAHQANGFRSTVAVGLRQDLPPHYPTPPA